MKTLMVTIPETFELDDKEALMAIASQLYSKGKLSVGQAAELAGLSKGTFLETFGGFGVSVLNHPASDLDRDIEHAKGYHI